jgi:hypothetical protein
MDKKAASPRMTLTSLPAVALWHAEINGQISDGHWENARPHGHYKFWYHCEVVFDPSESKLERNGNYAEKSNYALLVLPQLKWDAGDATKYSDGDKYILRGRMLKCGQMAVALGAVGRAADVVDFMGSFRAFEELPADLETFRAKKAANDWGHDFIAKYMDKIDDELAVAFYRATYTHRTLVSDLRLIKATMASASQW